MVFLPLCRLSWILLEGKLFAVLHTFTNIVSFDRSADLRLCYICLLHVTYAAPSIFIFKQHQFEGYCRGIQFVGYWGNRTNPNTDTDVYTSSTENDRSSKDVGGQLQMRSYHCINYKRILFLLWLIKDSCHMCSVIKNRWRKESRITTLIKYNKPCHRISEWHSYNPSEHWLWV